MAGTDRKAASATGSSHTARRASVCGRRRTKLALFLFVITQYGNLWVCIYFGFVAARCTHALYSSSFSSVSVSVLQAGWKENHATFMCELKNLQASGLTTLGHALRTAFDLLNLNRLVSGIDNYGQVPDTL